MKTLILLITLLFVFVAGYMLGVVNTRPPERRPPPQISAPAASPDN